MMSIMNQSISKACGAQNDTLYENRAYLYYEPLSGGRYGAVPTPTLPVPIPGRDREVRLDMYSRHDPNEYYVWRLNTIEINKPGLGQG